MDHIPLGLTFDDVLLVPQYSEIRSRQTVDLRTRISKNVPLNIPLVSSNMDTVTESGMAIAMARNGGIGIIHRYCTIEQEVAMVQKVKRAESYIIYDPYTVAPDDKIGSIKETTKRTGVHTYLVVKDGMLRGILTNRDIKYADDNDMVSECMTGYVIADSNPNITMEMAKDIMYSNKIQKLPIVNSDGTIKGLVCLKDIERMGKRPLANLDGKGRLRCGAAIGIKEDALERARRLVEVEVDVLVIDIAHGHSKICIDTLRMIKDKFPNVDVIAGNVATASGARDLIDAGADGIKLGIGNGGICITRMVSGSGVPQLTALMDAAKVCKEHDVPLISDGGNKNSGNICKALAAGAECVMLGRLIAGSDESPGAVGIKDGKRVKIIRGMASYEANLSNAIRQGLEEPDSISSHVEGVQGYVPYTGPISDTLTQICNGIRSGVSYSGASNIKELQRTAKFIRLTSNGVTESGVHDIMM